MVERCSAIVVRENGIRFRCILNEGHEGAHHGVPDIVLEGEDK